VAVVAYSEVVASIRVRSEGDALRLAYQRRVPVNRGNRKITGYMLNGRPATMAPESMVHCPGRVAVVASQFCTAGIFSSVASAITQLSESTREPMIEL